MPDWRVDTGKILHYLPNDQSPSGVAKAKFFLSRGFNREDWEGFRDALITHARTARLEELDLTRPYGAKRIFVCSIVTPDERSPCIRTVWQQRDGDHWLVTAYPFG